MAFYPLAHRLHVATQAIGANPKAINKGISMPQTISQSGDFKTIAGVFSKPDDANEAVIAFRESGVPPHNIQVVSQADKGSDQTVYPTVLKDRGMHDSQVGFYDTALRNGKTYVAIHEVTDPAPIVEIFDRYGAEFNPNGDRNVRQDVSGLTAGAGAGAIVGGAIGLVTGGPVGAAAGAAAGALVGGGTGAAAGKAIEHNK